MRYYEFASTLVENVDQTAAKPLTKNDVETVLRSAGYEDFKINGNKINVIVQIPSGAKKNEFRASMLDEILGYLEKQMPQHGPTFVKDPGLSSLGGIVFSDSPVVIVVKDSGKQGDKSAGVANELELASLLQSVVEKFGRANVTFVDPRGKKLSIEDCTEVDVAGRSTAGRRKADVVLNSESQSLPISIKKLDAEVWESADNMFGARAKEVIKNLVEEGIIKLNQIGTRNVRGTTVPVYELSREIVMEPTEEEALSAIFGSDINPEGGIVIQTFKPEHFTQDGENVTVDAHAVIAGVDDIPESHVMVWLIRNDSTRNGGSLGIAGLRPLGVTLQRGIGKKGTKDVVMVDKDGNVTKF
jgi:hypothetical protein